MYDQIFTLAAVAIGAITTYAATTLADRSRWKRQVGIRWDESRLRAYVDFANSAKVITTLVSRVMAARGVVTAVAQIDIDEGRGQIARRGGALNAV